MTLGIMELLGGGSFSAAAPLEAFCVRVFKMRMCKMCWQQTAWSLLHFSWSGAFLWMHIGAEGSWLSCTMWDGAEWGISSYLGSDFFGFVSYLKKCVFLYLYQKGASWCATRVSIWGSADFCPLFALFPLVCGLYARSPSNLFNGDLSCCPCLVSPVSHIS